ncbi:MAG: TetR/AcrR family transcriptional regulator [Acidobacteria bacterium]|nr:TetR/AcrR family transcriptional regulator [Acidobacteriota bacterium]
MFVKTKQEVLSEFRCSQISQAARKVFAKKGFDETTVEDIAHAAGIAKGTLYLYFRSKKKIYLAALREGILALHEKVQQEVEAAPSVEDKLRAYIFTKLRYFEENWDFFRIYHSEWGNVFARSADVQKNFKRYQEQQARMLEGVLQEGAQQGLLRPIHIPTTASVIYDVTRALIARRLLEESQSKAEEDAEFIFDLIWNGICHFSPSLSRKT